MKIYNFPIGVTREELKIKRWATSCRFVTLFSKK
jgi:hypothetical protein